MVIGTFGTYSQRLNITFEIPHPEFGKIFSTKYYKFTRPGVIEWGYEGRKFNIFCIEESTFDDNATNHTFKPKQK